MTLSDQALDALLKRLHLANTRRAWRELTRRAEQEEWSYRDFLALLVSEEITQRQQTRLDRLVRRARFPFLKTIDDFNFIHQSTVRLALLGSALAPEFVTDGRCLILSGKPGRGKTHLAVAIAYRAIQNGSDARFVTAAELIDDLSAAFRSGRLADALATYIHPGVLVVDEVGYLTYGTDAANMLFHVVNDRHRRKRAMIFTTNKALTAWGRVLHDDDLAHAIVDRILERGRLLTLDGPSMRTKHLGLDDPTSNPASTQLASPSGTGARISGIEAPEFPEPTPRYAEFAVLDVARIVTRRALTVKDWASDTEYFRDMQRCPPPLGQWIKVELTPAAKERSKEWKKGNDYHIPVQIRQLVDVTGISFRTANEADVEYQWTWKDLVTFSPRSPYTRGTSSATALFRLYDDGWRLIDAWRF